MGHTDSLNRTADCGGETTEVIWRQPRLTTMITNIIATIVVTLVTNTSERFPTHQEPDNEAMAKQGYTLMYFSKTVPDANPTNKWVRTTVKRISTLHGVYADKKLEWPISEEPVSDTEVEYALRQKWDSVSTNAYKEPWPFLMNMTNMVVTNATTINIGSLCVTNYGAIYVTNR